MKMQKGLCGLIFLVFVAFGCGDDAKDKGEGNNESDRTWTPADVEAEQLKAFGNYSCKVTFECPEWSDPFLMMITGRFTDKAACEAGIGDALAGLLQLNLVEQVTAGRSEFDGTKAQACFDAFDAVLANACSGASIADLESLCDPMIVGLVAEGGNCGDSSECADESLDCVYEQDNCYGTCQTEPGDSCDCTDEQYCDYEIETPECKALKAAGEACDGSEECTSTTRCVSGTCGAPMANLLDDGEACTLAFDDQGAATCKPGSGCIDLMASQEGVSGTCGALKAEGGSCLFSTECQAGKACTGTDLMTGMTGVCGGPLDDGEMCMLPFECKSGNCDQGTCKAPGDDCVIP
jgi:hypothetical protein